MQKALKIGWIGTGVMGNSMAGHLINKGYQVSVYNRTKSKTDNLVEKGAQFKTPNGNELIFNFNIELAK